MERWKGRVRERGEIYEERKEKKGKKEDKEGQKKESNEKQGIKWHWQVG